MSGPDLRDWYPLGNPDPNSARKAYGVRLDVKSPFVAGDETQANHHVLLAVESEFKARDGEANWNGQYEDVLGPGSSRFLRFSRDFYASLGTSSDFIPESGEGEVDG